MPAGIVHRGGSGSGEQISFSTDLPILYIMFCTNAEACTKLLESCPVAEARADGSVSFLHPLLCGSWAAQVYRRVWRAC